MGQFKPMVKMYTDEPSVILKLKKGGKVKSAGHDDGFKSMSDSSGSSPFAPAEKGKAPKKPSMADRRKAMNPNMYAKGGKVAHKQIGGVMPGAMGAMATPVGAATPMAPMSRAALGRMSPAERARRAAVVRRALTGMKSGGSTDASCAKLERELEHHKSMPASKAHGKASGGKIDSAEIKTTLKNSVKPYAKTKMDTAKKDTAHGTGEVKEGKPGGYAMGGSIMGNEAAYENTKMVTAGKGKTNGTTGGVRMGNAGGFKHGGKAMKYASGGAIDAKMTRTTVEGSNWENRPANTSKPGKTNTKTGEVKESNAGGYKKGGSAKKAYATGGDVDMGQADRTLRQAPRGDTGRGYIVVDKSGKTMSSHKSQSDAIRGALKSDDYKVKRQYAAGGNVVDDGKAQKMPRHFVSRPVANSLQSGTFKRGGKVMKYAGGDAVQQDPGIARENRRREAEREAQKAENIGMRESILGAPRRAFEAIKGMMSSDKSVPAGSVTKTEKSVTVAPAKKRGGKVC